MSQPPFQVVDLTCYEGDEGEMPAAVVRIRHFYGAIASAASLAPAGEPFVSALRCRRRPGHKPCAGFLVVHRQEVPPQIIWECPACGDAGCITSWEDSEWDLTQFARDAGDAPEELLEVVLDPEAYEEIRRLPIIEPELDALLHTARIGEEGVLLRGIEEELESLQGQIAFEANHERRKKRRELLDDAYLALDAALGGEELLDPLSLLTGLLVGAQSETELQEIFPVVPEARVEPGTHRIKVTLRGVRPLVWRRLEVPSSMALSELHEVLQVALGWSDAHLYRFRHGTRVFATFVEEEADLDDDPEDVELGEVAPAPGDRLVYEYGSSDVWEHDLLVEEVRVGETGPARCLGGRRPSPPEDCGGPEGYRLLTEALADPAHPAHEEAVDWCAGPLDCESFDAAAIDRRLKAIPAELF